MLRASFSPIRVRRSGLSSAAAVKVVYQYSTFSNKVGVEISNLKVVNSNRMFKSFGYDIGNNGFRAVCKPYNHASMQSASIDPSLSFNIEGVVRGGINGFSLAILRGNCHMGNLVGDIRESLNDFLVGDLTGFFVLSQDHITGLDVFDCNQTNGGNNRRSSNKALRSHSGFCCYRYENRGGYRIC